jgi:VanZ family protein
MTLPQLKIRRETSWALALACTITICSGFPAPVPDLDWLAFDKVGHFIAYGALATAIVRHPSFGAAPGLDGKQPGSTKGWWAVLIAAAYGLGDEFRQSLTAGIRQYDLADWSADTAGAIVAVAFYLHWRWYRRVMETRVSAKRTKPRVENSAEPLPNSAE